MNPLITLELSFAKSDVSSALRQLRIAQMHRGKPTYMAPQIETLQRALESLERVDALALSNQPLVREGM